MRLLLEPKVRFAPLILSTQHNINNSNISLVGQPGLVNMPSTFNANFVYLGQIYTVLSTPSH